MSAALLLLSLALAPAQPPAEEPKFSGRPLREWLADLKNDDLLVREEAVEVLGSAGVSAKEAVPALEKLLKADSLSLRMRAGMALFRITGRGDQAAETLTEALRDDIGPQTRLQLLFHLQQLGTAAARAAPAVLELVDHDDLALRSQAQNFFTMVGRPALMVVLERLGDKELRHRRQAALVIARLGTMLGDQGPAIARGLSDEDRKVRTGCARGLWAAGNTSREVVDILAETVRDGSADERRELLDSLAIINFDAARTKAAQPIFEAAMKSSDLGTRIRGASVLCGIDTKPDTLLPVLIEGLKSPNRQHWGPAAQGIGKLGPRGAPALTAMIDLIKSPHTGTIPELMEAFAQIGAPAVAPLVEILENAKDNQQLIFSVGGYLTRLGNTAAPKMLPLLEHKHPRVRQMACQVLGNAHEAAPKSAAKLAERLKDDDPAVRQAALNAFNQLGAAAREASPAILEMNKTATGFQRMQCLQTLERIGGDRDALLAAAKEGLKDAMPQVRGAGLSLLATIDPRDPILMTEGEKLLKDQATRYVVVNMINRLGPAAEKLAPTLIDVLRTDRNQMTRHQLVPVIGRLGRAAKDATPLLVDCLKERDPYLRQVSLIALRQIGGADPKVLVPALLTLLNEDQGAFYRSQAMELLGEQGAAAADAVPQLLEELKRPALQFQQIAATALVRIDPARARKEGVPLLEKHLTGVNPAFIAQAILTLNPEHTGAMDALRNTLKEPDETKWWVRMHAANALAAMGPASKALLPELRAALKDKNASVRLAAALAVWKVGKEAEAPLATLTAELDAPHPPYLLTQVMTHLMQMGPAARDAVPRLLKLRTHSDASVRAQAVAAIKAIDPEAAAKAGLP
jgi:HEAT repeat protein